MRFRPFVLLGTFALVLAAAPQSSLIPADEMTMTAHTYMPGIVLRAQADLVDIPIVLRDADRKPIAGLTKDNFLVQIDGKTVPITNFAAERAPEVPAPKGDAAAAVNAASAPAAAMPPQPRYIVLYIDDLHTTAADLAVASRAAQQYLQSGFRPGDHVAILTSAPDATLDFTTDLGAAAAALKSVTYHGRTSAEGGCPLITPTEAYEISHSFSASNEAFQFALGQAVKCLTAGGGSAGPDATAQAAQMVHQKADMVWGEAENQAQDALDTIEGLVRALAHRAGDRVIVIASDGFMTPTLEDRLDAIIDQALRAQVMINGLDTKGLFAGLAAQPEGFTADNPIPDDSKFLHGAANYRDRTATWDAMQLTAGMAQIAFGTGGEMFENSNDLPHGFQDLASAPSDSYHIGIKPPSVKADGSFHKVVVKVLGTKAVDVEYRPGYFSPKDNSGPAFAEERLKAALDREIAAATPSEAVPARLQVAPRAGGVTVRIAVDPSHFAWHKQADRSADDLVFAAGLIGASDGQWATGARGDMNLTLRAATLAAITKPGTGITTGLDLNAPAGDYTLRLIVHEVNGGAWTAINEKVTIQ